MKILELITELIVSALLVGGGFFVMIAAIGVLRLPDVYTRLHATSKAVTLGLALPLIALFIVFPSITLLVKILIAVFFIIITTPIAAHLLARASYRENIPQCKSAVVDEYKGVGNLESPKEES